MTTTPRTQFETASRALAQWEGRTVSVYFQHEPSGDGTISHLSGLTIDEVQSIDEWDREFGGGALSVSLSFGGSPIGAVMVHEELLGEAIDYEGRGLELRMHGAKVAFYEDDGDPGRFAC
jgi:hypothetical protein